MRLVKHAQKFISDHITEGSIVLDLTSGNGHDSLYLAKTVGEQGKLFAVDIQKSNPGDKRITFRRKLPWPDSFYSELPHKIPRHHPSKSKRKGKCNNA